METYSDRAEGGLAERHFDTNTLKWKDALTERQTLTECNM